jgi:hypothetical protein
MEGLRPAKPLLRRSQPLGPGSAKLNESPHFLGTPALMLSIKTISESASAERLAEQVREDHVKYCEEQEENAIKKLRLKGLYFTRGDAADLPDQPISVQSVDLHGAVFWLQLRREDEARDPLGYCIGCKLPLKSPDKAVCWLGCRNTALRLFPSMSQSVPLKKLPDGSTWTLTRKSRGIFLTLTHPDYPEKLKAPSPKVVGILKH